MQGGLGVVVGMIGRRTGGMGVAGRAQVFAHLN